MSTRRTSISMPPKLWAIAEELAVHEHYPDVSSFLQHLIRQAWKQKLKTDPNTEIRYTKLGRRSAEEIRIEDQPGKKPNSEAVRDVAQRAAQEALRRVKGDRQPKTKGQGQTPGAASDQGP